MGKYIIEVGDAYVKYICGEGDMLCLPIRINEFENNWLNTNIPLTPYTEPDLEQVNRDYDAWYEKGLADAWDAARKICAMDARSRDKVFGAVIIATILEHNPASEAIEKIRQYEREKEEQIQVGDEVENTQTGVKFIVTHLWENNRGEQGVSGFNQECSAFSTTLSLVVKTGQHFPEIAAVLAKMKEES